MDPYEQYLADAEYEDYLRQLDAENATQAAQKYAVKERPSYTREETLGPDYTESVGANAFRGVYQAPEAAWKMGGDLIDFAGSPIQTIQDAGVEKTARTVGGLASGTAGAMAGAPLGASWGAALGSIFPGPGTVIGGAAGGILGGAAGFGAGMLGFDFLTDVTDPTANGFDAVRPTDEYLKDLAYNTGQGALMGGATEALRAVPRVKNLGKGFTQEGAEARVAERLQQLEPGISQRIDTALLEGADNPFLEQRSLGELIDSDVLKNAQRTIAMSGPEPGTTGSPFGRSAEARRIRNDAQLKYLDQIEQSPMTMGDVQASIQQGIDSKIAAGQRGITSAEDTVSSVLADLPPKIDSIEAGNTIRQNAAMSKEAARGEMSQYFEGTGSGIVDITPAAATAAELMPKYFREVGPQPNGELVKFVESLAREGEPTGLLNARGEPMVAPVTYTLKDIQALRSQALDIAESSDPRAARVAGEIAKSLKLAGDEAVKAGTVTPEEITNWKNGISARKEIGRKFESSATPTKTVLSKQPYGEFRVPDSAVPSKYFRAGDKGTREAIRNYKDTVGATTEALDPLYRYATDSFRDAVVRDGGKIDTKAAGSWLRRHASALEELPDLKRQLSNVDEAQRFLNEKYGDLTRTEAEWQKGALKSVLQVDPEKAISAMLSGKDMVKRTISTVQHIKKNDPEALTGLRRGVIEHLKAKSYIPDGKVSLEEASLPRGAQFDGTVRGGTLKAEWEKIKPAMERSKLFTDSQMKGFDYLYKDKASQLSVEKAKAPGGSDSAQNLSTLAALGRAASSGFLRNLPAGRYIALLAPVLRAIPQAKFTIALEEALLNPRIARDLLQKATTKNFVRSAETIFKEDIAKAFGEVTPGAVATGAKTAITMSPITQAEPKKDELKVPKQAEVIASKSFPDPKELLTPPAKGMLKRTSFDVSRLSPETKARIQVESSNNPDAVSPKGAQGLSQLMPATAQDIAAELGETYMPITPGMTPEQRQASIEQNVRFGNHYMNVTLPKIDKAFKNRTLAWAAYNAGPGRVQEAMRMAGTSSDVNKILSNLPKGVQKETIPYVQNIEKLLAQYGNA